MIPGHAHPDELLLDEPTRRLCAAITGGALTPVRLAVIAPGGHGKTALLDLLAATGSARRYRPGTAEGPLLLVDDAHLLSDNDFAELADYAADARACLVVAARPRPRPAALTALLGRLRGQVVLRPFDLTRTQSCLRALAGDPAAAPLVLAQTGGVPGWVHRVAPHLPHPPGTDHLPPAAVEEFRLDVERLPADQVTALLAAEVNADATALAGLLDRTPTEAAALVDQARATGLLAPDGTLLPLAAAALRVLVPADRRADVHDRLAAARLGRTGPTREFATALLAAEASSPAAGAVYAAAAAEAEPALAVRLHAAAEHAGHPVDEVGRAEAEALSGDLDAALRRADALVAAGEHRAARVAAAALAYRGQPARSAELYQWAGSGPFAAIGLAAAGRLDDARAAVSAPAGNEPPTLFATAMSLAARGVLDSVSGRAAALSTVVRAAEVLAPVGRHVLIPDSPAALGAILAVHSGELGIAEPLLARALDAGTGGDLLRPRHALLAAWVAMVRGDTPRDDPAAVAGTARRTPRDRLFEVGLAVGTARRAGDLAALRGIWEQAYEAVVRHEVDLFTLLPLGEFAVAAARLGDRERFAPHLDRAWALLRDLGDPPAWASVLHWHCLHAEITAEITTAEAPEVTARRHATAVAHAEALAGAAEAGLFHAALADAARCWLDIAGGSEVDAERVEKAARGLHTAGLRWDGARLAGQAAIRTTDRKRMLGLLDCARALRGSAATRSEGAAPDPSGMARLSDRELQVAELVLVGLTYKQVGDRLFISAKTVEHHMARMRSRLGATSRGDLLAQLRTLLGERIAG